ncbi:hypothetical protein N7537_001268 [Penicillium hordei]|uniref:Uncharacterized protein n=1 Tax=Penicillium hordei TaxID=40994 RepID=A0AAD6H8R5_9EURO|nr:uncharacterized protein N7537_001268 [Penicillium hordei]KAJ5616154.1 hypothetical protein N7537_001268 [Penicillium hordei]
MAETRSSPEVITASLPALEVQCEKKFKCYDVSNFTHIVVHLSDMAIRNLKNITNSNADPPCEFDNEDYLDIIGKMLSVTFFGNENQLEWLDTERVGRRKFVAFTNIEKKEKRAQSQSPGHGKLQVVEVMFMRTSPRDTQKIFWRPARATVLQRVQIRMYDLVEMVRVRVMRTRSNVVPRRKGSASA